MPHQVFTSSWTMLKQRWVLPGAGKWSVSVYVCVCLCLTSVDVASYVPSLDLSCKRV